MQYIHVHVSVYKIHSHLSTTRQMMVAIRLTMEMEIPI